jgi:Tol biopolymer transport system component
MGTGAESRWVSGISTMNLDGTSYTELVIDSLLTFTSPVWSPDGNRIAFMAYKQQPLGYSELYVKVMDANGDNLSTIASPQVGVPSDRISMSPPSVAWSPDGKRLAFTMHETNGEHIFVINKDGSGLTKVTSKPNAHEGYLSWSR